MAGEGREERGLPPSQTDRQTLRERFSQARDYSSLKQVGDVLVIANITPFNETGSSNSEGNA